jgi:hypothetical protein
LVAAAPGAVEIRWPVVAAGAAFQRMRS